MYYLLTKTPQKKHKYEVYFPSNGKTVKFGDNRYQDYLTHKDPQRKRSYLKRHRPNEDWTSTGIFTPGFWSRHLLWSKPTLIQSKEILHKKYGLTAI